MVNIKDYSKIYNAFARKLLKYYADSDKNENIIISPYSVLCLLAIAADATAGETSEEIIHAISSEFTKESIVPGEVRNMLEDNKAFSSANAVCVRNDIEKSIKEAYVAGIREKLGGELFSSRDFITDVNKWAKINTNGMIDKVADESMKDIVMCLLNAICFDGKWTKHYTRNNIEYKWFTNSDKSRREVAMIRAVESEYIENKTFTGFVKPYKDIDYSFMALLPKTISNAAMKTAINTLDFSEIFAGKISNDVRILLPEFKYASGADLKSLLEDFGVTTVFTDHADFSPISSEWLKLEAVIHKARIEVTRSGTKAATVTMGLAKVGRAIPLDKPKVVELDRPFIYAIMNNTTGLPVFTGIVNKL